MEPHVETSAAPCRDPVSDAWGGLKRADVTTCMNSAP